MKKFFLVLLVLFGVCFLFSKNEEEIRVRVVSNSDSNSDLMYKAEVVQYLKTEIFSNMELNDKSFEEKQDDIERILNEKFDNITVSYTKHTFKNKTYNGSALENKEYKTLLIYIGNGQGSNWWGSIFDDTLQSESIDEVKYEWYLNEIYG